MIQKAVVDRGELWLTDEFCLDYTRQRYKDGRGWFLKGYGYPYGGVRIDWSMAKAILLEHGIIGRDAE